MKRLMRAFALLAAMMLIVTACADDTADTEAPADTAAQETSDGLPDLEGREVTIGVENAYLPFNYIPIGETEGQGWDYDAFRAICDLINCTPVFVQSGWPAVLEEVANGEIDTAADGISITDERKETMDFSDAYMTVDQQFIVQVGDDRWADADALIADGEAIVATQVGTTNYNLAVDLVGEDRIQAFDQFGLAVAALIAGDVDAVIIDNAAGQGYVGENADSVVLLAGALQADPLGFAFPKGSDLVDPINQAIAALKADGTLDALGKKYFTDAFTITYDDIEG